MEEAARLLVALGMLLGAAVSDVRTRRVPNRYWAVFVGAALAFLLADVRGGDWAQLRWTYGLALVLTLAFYLFWRIGLFGGADAKGLMVLAFLVPQSPPHQAIVAPYTVAALLNGSVLLLLLPVGLLAFNAARGDLRLPAALVGVRMRTEAARRQHVWPLQRVGDDGQLRWKWWQQIGGGLGQAYDRLEAARVERVWVTPKLPFLVAVLAGLAVAPWLGNLVLRLMQAALA